MKTTVVRKECSEHEMSILFWRSNKELMNLLRYGLIACIDVPGIDHVTIKKNTSVMTDDILAHRLGLMPLHFSSEENGTISLHVVCKAHQLIVTCAFFRCVGCSFSSNEEVLCILNKGEEIELGCKIVKGNARTHARFSPVCATHFVPKPILRVNERLRHTLSADAMKTLNTICKDATFTSFKHDNFSTLWPDIDAICEETDSVTLNVSASEDTFLFSFESTGVTSCEHLIRLAVDALVERLANVRSNLIAAHSRSSEMEG